MSVPKRARRCQLSVPGSSEKMLQKAAQSAADHVFCDLEDAVAPSAKVEARAKVAWALNNLDWGNRVRCVRVNDVNSQWCHDDIISLVEQAGRSIDTIMLPKPYSPADVIFLDRLLTQLEAKLRLDHRIGIEVLIEEVQALQAVDDIARCSDRLECLIFGMGDYSASQGINVVDIGDSGGYPGDIFHYARFRITVAARAAGIDAIDGPFGDFKDGDAYRREAVRARALGMVGKWAIHPSQISIANETFSPNPEEVDRARRIEAVMAQAEANGLGAASFEGVMIDAATVRLVRNVLSKAELYGI